MQSETFSSIGKAPPKPDGTFLSDAPHNLIPFFTSYGNQSEDNAFQTAFNPSSAEQLAYIAFFTTAYEHTALFSFALQKIYFFHPVRYSKKIISHNTKLIIYNNQKIPGIM